MRFAPLALAILSACRPAAQPAAPSSAKPAAVAADVDPDLARRVRVFARDGSEIALGALLDRLAEHEVVMVGETHTDDTTHRLELAILEGVRQRRQGEAVLSLEMFERDVQKVLDAYLRGEIDEAEMLAGARPWGNYATDYRPLVEAARKHELPVVAANFPRPLLREVKDASSFAKARAANPDWLPREVRPATDAYWARVDRATRGHMGGGGGDRSYAAQNLWDNSMAEAIVDALTKRPRSTVVHVVGGFHVARGEGTIAQLRARRPDTRIATVMLRPTHDLATVEPEVDAAEFVAYAQAIVQTPSGGPGSATFADELGFTVVRPNARERLPLVVWLPDDGERLADVRLWLELVLGDDAMAIVVDPPGHATGTDGRVVTQWDLGIDDDALAQRSGLALARLIDWADRQLAPSRVIVAGRGAGATTALWAAFDGDVEVPVLAIAPVASAALQHTAIPEARPRVERIEIVDAAPERPALAGVLDSFARAGVEPVVTPASANDRGEAGLRAALGVAAPTKPGASAIRIALPVDTPLARVWAELLVAVRRRAGVAAELAPGSRGDEILDGAFVRRALDQSGGPSPAIAFGGATLLVVDAKMPKGERAAWTAWAEAATKRRSVLRPLHVCDLAGGCNLEKRVAELVAKGTSHILLVPAAFAVTDERSRALLGAAGRAPEGVTIEMLPGLGGDAVAAIAKPPKPPAPTQP